MQAILNIISKLAGNLWTRGKTFLYKVFAKLKQK